MDPVNYSMPLTEDSLSASGLPTDVIDAVRPLMSLENDPTAIDHHTEYYNLMLLIRGFANIQLPRYDSARHLFPKLAVERARNWFFDGHDQSWKEAQDAGLILQMGRFVYVANNMSRRTICGGDVFAIVDTLAEPLSLGTKELCLYDDKSTFAVIKIIKMLPYYGKVYFLNSDGNLYQAEEFFVDQVPLRDIPYGVVNKDGRAIAEPLHSGQKSKCAGNSQISDIAVSEGRLVVLSRWGAGVLEDKSNEYIEKIPDLPKPAGDQFWQSQGLLGIQTTDFMVGSGAVFFDPSLFHPPFSDYSCK